MKYRDPILEELHKVRDAISKAHDYDVDKLFDCMRARQGKPPEEPCPHMPLPKRAKRVPVKRPRRKQKAS
jgi:hypothetical protein